MVTIRKRCDYNVSTKSRSKFWTWRKKGITLLGNFFWGQILTDFHYIMYTIYKVTSNPNLIVLMMACSQVAIFPLTATNQYPTLKDLYYPNLLLILTQLANLPILLTLTSIWVCNENVLISWPIYYVDIKTTKPQHSGFPRGPPPWY